MNNGRSKQEVGAEIVNDLLASVRNQFYADAPAKQWFQDRKFILRSVVLWPASWLNKRGVTLPPERYKSILLEIFQDIKRKGNTGAVTYWPGYLMHCVQEHFKHHGDDYYTEGKSLRSAVERSLMAFGRLDQAAGQPDPVRQMAHARSIIQPQKRRPKPSPKQGLLFDL
jgi:hypothetical protein